MIIHDVAQGSGLWIKARIGLPTASEFSKIVTPKGELSAQADKYCYRLLAEIIMKQPMQDLEGLEWIERGQQLEEQAMRAYGFINDQDTQAVGFITTDDGEIGASPDRLVGEDGLLEIKCPSPQVHIQYMLENVAEKYKPQIQGQLLVTERSWCDFFSYHPSMPPVHIHTLRDEAYISKLRRALSSFVELKHEYLAKIKSMGYFEERKEVMDIAQKDMEQRFEYGAELMAG